MTTQDHPAPQAESKDEQAERLRRVLSMKKPAQTPSKPSKPSNAQPKPATR